MSVLDSPTLPAGTEPLASLKILVFCTAVNSFTQRVLCQLRDYGFTRVSSCVATDEKVMCDAAERFQPDLVICPFLTRIIPDTVFKKYITLVVHPGPPGDAGPSSLDWALLGDTGLEADSTLALDTLLSTSHSSNTDLAARQRSHWGCIVFQANEHLDGGSIWAWDQYPLPPLGSITKAQLYQNQHSSAALKSLITAILRVYSKIANVPAEDRLRVKPEVGWEKYSLTGGLVFQGGPTHERPLIPAKARKPSWEVHTAEDVARIINASDSQPGAQFPPLTNDSKTSLFAYGAHLHSSSRAVPRTLYTSLGYAGWDDIPDGRVLATRHGAVFIKARALPGASAGVWITHGRVPKKAGSPLEGKVPMLQAILDAGHGKAVEGVQEWKQDSFDESEEGVWQEVWVKTEVVEGGLAQCVYWDFYNGAFSTRQCQTLLRALQWAVAPERGNVKVLALMGGTYFSNGIALNTIESHKSPGEETWSNINAIDDIVEFLVSDTHLERSKFMSGQTALCERGIVTVACLRGNAAAGGVALAAACDITIAGRGVVLNPAYRAMGLHGSEFHSYSYLARCGPTVAAGMLRNMLPQSVAESLNTGLIDISLGSACSTRAEIHSLAIAYIRSLFTATSSAATRTAPWAKPTPNQPLLSSMSVSKVATYKRRTTPLLHYRNEELGQMLLDCFHPTRSKRYHTRRYKFIRKVKASGTPSRYAGELAGDRDEEEAKEFDLALGWVRGEEWAWAGMQAPKSLKTSGWTRIEMYPGETPLMVGGERMEGGLEVPAGEAEVEAQADGVQNDKETKVESKGLAPKGHVLPQNIDSDRKKHESLIKIDQRALLAPSHPARKESYTTTSSTYSSIDHSIPTTLSGGTSTDQIEIGNDSLTSNDSTTFPLTPIATPKSPRAFFGRKSISGSRPRTAVSAAGLFTDTQGSLGKKEGTQKFKLFSKRISAALRSPSPPSPVIPNSGGGDPRRTAVEGTMASLNGRSGTGPRPEITPNGTIADRSERTNKRLSIPRPSSTVSARSNGGVSMDHAGGGGRTRSFGPGPIPVYERPNVPGDEAVEFPCLYDPESVGGGPGGQRGVVVGR